MADLLGIPRRLGAKENPSWLNLKKGIIPNEYSYLYDVAKHEGRVLARTKILFGELEHKEKGGETGEYSKMFDKSRYKYFLEAPFEISDMCCKVMKKSPIHKYNRETGRHPMTAQMAIESRLRTQKWIQNGCNGFNMRSPISNPMSFWFENDVLQYIYENKLPICPVYGDVVVDYGEDIDGQMDLSDFGLCNDDKHYKTTGCKRTGCMLCGFGCHLEKEGQGRFEMLKQTHPGMYGLLDKVTNNGVTFREAIEWTNEHGNLNIKL